MVNEKVFDLMFDLDATEEQLDSKSIYGSAKQGWMRRWTERTDIIFPLLDPIIVHIPAPATVRRDAPDAHHFIGLFALTGTDRCGQVTRGSLKDGP